MTILAVLEFLSNDESGSVIGVAENVYDIIDGIQRVVSITDVALELSLVNTSLLISSCTSVEFIKNLLFDDTDLQPC